MKHFLLLQSIDPGQQFTWEHSNLEVNKPKNRYANVIAYDHSRVLLSAIDGKPPVGTSHPPPPIPQIFMLQKASTTILRPDYFKNISLLKHVRLLI